MSAVIRRIQRAFGFLAMLAVLATANLALSGCNTIAGAGQDASSAGHDVTGGAKAVQKEIHQATGAATK